MSWLVYKICPLQSWLFMILGIDTWFSLFLCYFLMFVWNKIKLKDFPSCDCNKSCLRESLWLKPWPHSKALCRWIYERYRRKNSKTVKCYCETGGTWYKHNTFNTGMHHPASDHPQHRPTRCWLQQGQDWRRSVFNIRSALSPNAFGD